jgi:peptidoglycan DL-endopeptidase CwlO
MTMKRIAIHVTLLVAALAASLTLLAALHWAETQAGKPYIWGGTGPGGYDCSGLVQAAYRHAGISLPRTTYQMLADGAQLHWEPRADARWGDLAFYGPGHVELYMGNDDVNWTFGAHEQGQPIGRITFGGSWWPTAYYRVT